MESGSKEAENDGSSGDSGVSEPGVSVGIDRRKETWKRLCRHLNAIRGIGYRLDAMSMGFDMNQAIRDLEAIEHAAREARLMLMGGR